MLNVEVWDWDRSYTDDPLGRFQVKIGEELLSQKVWWIFGDCDVEMDTYIF